MSSSFRLSAVQRSDVGRQREVNEDAFGRYEPSGELLLERGCLYIVADGLGGHAAGDIASRLAVETILGEYYNSEPWEGPADTLVSAIELANKEICREAEHAPELQGMGTTAVVASIMGFDLTIANVGDSRAYRLRRDEINQLTRDHSWVAEAIDQGLITAEQARHHPDRHVIFRSLGTQASTEVDTYSYTLEIGDRLLLCTDGLTDMLSDEQIWALGTEPDLATAAEDLIAAANELGGVDNITVTMIQLEALSDDEPEEEKDTLGPEVPEVTEAETPAERAGRANSEERPTQPRQMELKDSSVEGGDNPSLPKERPTIPRRPVVRYSGAGGAVRKLSRRTVDVAESWRGWLVRLLRRHS